MRRDSRPRSDIFKMLMVDLATFNTFLAEFNVRATARLLQPWNDDALIGLLGEHRPDLVVFENGPRATMLPLANRLAAASPQPFVPVFADAESPPESAVWPPAWAEPVPIPGSIDPLDLRDVIAKIAWEAHLAEAKQWANPLTGLPGNPAIRAEVERRIESGAPFSLLYLDYDHFKAFNDAYGFSQGDAAILLLAQIVREVVAECGNPDDFIGHIGGDDLAVVTTPDRAEAIARGVIDRIGPEVELLYSDQDRQRGYTVVQRRRARERYPLMTLSIAGVSNVNRPLDSYLAVSEIAAEIKAHAKAKRGSNYVPDRRRGESLPMTDEREHEIEDFAASRGRISGWAAALRMPGWAQALLVLNLVIVVLVALLMAQVARVFKAVKATPRAVVTTAGPLQPPAPPPPLVLASFETEKGLQGWSASGYQGALASPQRAADAGEGKQSLRLTYALPKKGTWVVLTHALPQRDTNWSRYKRLQFMIQRPSDGGTVVQIQARDKGKYVWCQTLGEPDPKWATQSIALASLVGLDLKGQPAPPDAKPDWAHMRDLRVVVRSNVGATGGALLLDNIRLLP
jgi:diguanylate cyclase (GGDEF)-like protein